MKPAVRAVGLSKFYGSHWNPRSLLRQIVTGREPAHRIRALEGVSFQVEAGRALGVVGQNGSGKTTLLKLVSGAAHPSSGRVELDGSVGALLDLGAGFHPEFSGRENIRFSGALMGLEPDLVREAEDRIVAFSELEEFIDQPVRTYSAGMYVRLGFAVSTGFDPSVLVIDEALAVGDQPFQKKCTDRIVSIKKRGAAIVICSHNLYQIKTLCEEAVWLREGRPQSQGDAVTVVEDYGRYLGQASGPRNGDADTAGSQSPLTCRIESLRLEDGSGSRCESFRTGETLRLEIAAEFASGFRGRPSLRVAVRRDDGLTIHETRTRSIEELQALGGGRYRGRLTLRELPLLAGGYRVLVAACSHSEDPEPGSWKAVPFSVRSRGRESGAVRMEHRWSGGG